MAQAIEKLPDDPNELKAMLLAERARNERLVQIIKEMQRHRFGRRAETLPERADFPPGRAAERRLAPAADGHRDDLGDGGMQARNVGEGLFDTPIDDGVGVLAAQVAGHREVVNDIAER